MTLPPFFYFTASAPMDRGQSIEKEVKKMDERKIFIAFRKVLIKHSTIRLETKTPAIVVSCERRLGDVVQKGVKLRVVDASLEIYSDWRTTLSSSSDEGEALIYKLLQELMSRT